MTSGKVLVIAPLADTFADVFAGVVIGVGVSMLFGVDIMLSSVVIDVLIEALPGVWAGVVICVFVPGTSISLRGVTRAPVEAFSC